MTIEQGYTAPRKLILFNQQRGKCYYCQCEMLYLRKIPNDKKPAPETATIEHLVDRWDNNPEARLDPKNIVLACWKCNNTRNKIKEDSMSRETKALKILLRKKLWKISHLIKHNYHFNI